MSSWWQTKLLPYGLRYILSKTGIFEEKVLDLANLNIKVGARSSIEVKDVGLNIAQLSKYAKLPPCLRIETARILHLRLTVPADFFQSSIVFEVDGVEVVVRLHEEEVLKKPRDRSPTSTKTPQHRKTDRRLRSPPPYDPGGLHDAGDEVHIPTTQEVAKSFLMEEPLPQRRELEASVAATSRSLEDSFISQSSDGDDVGTGVSVGVPGFLASFLQGLIDRVKVDIKNVQLRLETETQGGIDEAVPVTFQLQVGSVQVEKLETTQTEVEKATQNKRQVKIRDIALDLLTDAAVLADLSEIPSQSSRSGSRHASQASASETASFRAQSPNYSSPPLHSSIASVASTNIQPFNPDIIGRPAGLEASISTVDADRFADAGEEEDSMSSSAQSYSSKHDIRLGDDNISWGSRRSQTSAPADDLWKSMMSEEELPGSAVLETERTSTPRAYSSRGSSPYAQRSRLAPSPSNQLEQSQDAVLKPHQRTRRYGEERGAWSGSLHSQDGQSHSSQYPSRSRNNFLEAGTLADNASMMTDPNYTDNKRAAFEHYATHQHDAEDRPYGTGHNEDLAQSQIFDHETARSMYMSAMTSSPRMHVPGGWESQSQAASSQTSSPSSDADVGMTLDRGTQGDASTDDPLVLGNETPRAQSPLAERKAIGTRQTNRPKTSRQLVYVDSVLVLIPAGKTDTAQTPTAPTVVPSSRSRSAYDIHRLPGTFSAYSERSSAHFQGFESIHGSSGHAHESTENHPGASDQDASIELALSSILTQIDISTLRLIYDVGIKATNNLQTTEARKRTEGNDAPSPAQTMPLMLSLQNFRLSLLEQIDANVALAASARSFGHEILTLTCNNLQFSQMVDTSLRISSIALYLGSQELISLRPDSNAAGNMNSPSHERPAVLVKIASNKVTAGNRTVTDVYVETTSIQVMLDLTNLDSTFSSFGGLSGVLELGTSILSESGSSSPVLPPKTSKGVRFASGAEYTDSKHEMKLNARIAGVTATVHGPCTVVLATTTIKAIYRESLASATIEHIALSVPHLDPEHDAPILVDLVTLRFEYFVTPPDKDLERLLSLLTPSKDKYDNDDDILIETLLRQRRKGALLRVGIKDIQIRIDDWASLSDLSGFGDELGKLAVVANYLPEDDRPGLLTLARLGEIDIQVPVNEQFGSIRLISQNVNLAHVGPSALLAFSIETVKARRPGASDLVHPLLPAACGPDFPPMIMARMLGDEEVPIIKIKLYNVCLEYSVPTVLALSGPDAGDMNTEEMVMEIAQSVANLAVPPQSNEPLPRQRSDLSGVSAKKTAIDLLVHDSAVGLNPQKLSSKALFVLSNAHISTVIPPGDTTAMKFNLRRAELFITDNVIDESDRNQTSETPSVSFVDSSQRLAFSLGKSGYVPVGSMRSAVVEFCATPGDSSGAKCVEVTLKNELLLLETCADSTQTLFATLGALAPPTPPSKQPQYLTQPMTIEDMMASFTGDAVEQRQASAETLFDIKDEPDEGASLLFDAQTGDEDETDDLLADSEMTSSLYGPVSGVFGMDDDQAIDPDEDFQETAESLLEDDPFEMTISPTDVPMSDQALLRDLRKQSKSPVSDMPIDLGIWEVEDLGFDALGHGQQALGTKNRFAAPFVGSRDKRGLDQPRKLTFTLKLRDFHIIWHLFDGYDWDRTRQGIVNIVEAVEKKAEERKARRRQSLNDREEDESHIGDILFNSIYIGVPADGDAQELRRRINQNIDDQVSVTESVPLSGISRPTNFSGSGQPRGPHQRRRLKLARSRAHKISFELKGVSADVFVYPPESGNTLSAVDLRVKDFEIFDNVPTSSWRKFLTHLNGDPAAREMAKPMFHILLENVKTLESHAASELTLDVTVLPLRLHVDQDALDFITRFFEFKDKEMVPDGAPSEQPFIQRIEVHTVDMCLDYKPKRIDYVGLRSGRSTEFMNFVTLDGANIRLKHAIVYGLRGFDAINPTLNGVWMPDIRRNQLPTILAGLAPVRSLVNVASGIRDVVAIPVREYQKDGRIVRSIQKGAFHFGKTTASELARLGAKVALGTQTMLTTAEGYLSPAAGASSSRPSSVRRVSSEQGWHDIASDDDESAQRAVSAYANQPLGIFSGLRTAKQRLEHDLLTAKDALIAVQGEILESRSPGGAAAAVARHAPTVILRPVIGATKAAGTALLGVGNQIDRSNMRRVDDKYKRR